MGRVLKKNSFENEFGTLKNTFLSYLFKFTTDYLKKNFFFVPLFHGHANKKHIFGGRTFF